MHSNVYKRKFQQKRSLCELLQIRDEKEYLLSTEESINKNSMQFYKYVYSINSNNSISECMILSDKKAECGDYWQKNSAVYRKIKISKIYLFCLKLMNHLI